MFVPNNTFKMEKCISIEQFLSNLDSNKVYSTKSSIVSGLLLLIAGLFFIALPNFVSVSTYSFIPSLFLITGIILGLLGIVKMVFRKTYFVSASNKQKLKSFDINFDVSEKEKLIQLYKSGKIDTIHNLKRSTSNGLRITGLANDDLSMCFSQVIGYIPFEDVPFTEPLEHTRLEAEYLKKMLQ